MTFLSLNWGKACQKKATYAFYLGLPLKSCYLLDTSQDTAWAH